MQGTFYPHIRFLSLSGEGVRPFLNRLVTNSVESLKEGRGLYNCLCTPKGKIISDFYLFSNRDKLILRLHADRVESVRQTLEQYIIAEHIEIQEENNKALLFLNPPDEVTEGGVHFSLWGMPAYEIWGPQSTLNQIEKSFSAPVLSDQEQEVLRIESMTPRYGIDMDENTIPQEAGLGKALDFEKGCYVGQETIARLHYQGHVNKVFTLFKLEAILLPNKGEVICAENGDEVGVITSSCFSNKHGGVIALGYVKYKHRDKTEFHILGKTAKKLRTK